VKRRRSLQVMQRDEHLLPQIQALKTAHPCWGYRRIWAYLRFIEQQPVNKKRSWRLMREHRLLVPPNLRLKANRTSPGSKPKPTRPNEWWGIAMTKVLVEGFGWISIVIVLDWYPQAVVGDDASLRGMANPWLEALDMAVNRRFPNGARDQGVSLMSDNGCQPPSMVFMEACNTLGMHQTCTSYSNPKGNADTERFMRTLTEECLWLQEWTCPCELINALHGWIASYNAHYLHAVLGDKAPSQLEQEYQTSHSTPFVAA
jgi:putative transposase